MTNKSQSRLELIDQYISGDMSDTELEAFEMELLSDPDLLGQAEVAAYFEQAIQAAASDNEIRRYKNMRSAPYHTRFARRSVLVPVLSALALVSIGLNLSLWMRSGAPVFTDTAPEFYATSNVLTVHLSQVRGARFEPTTEIRLKPDVELVVLMPQFLPIASSEFKLFLLDESGAALWSGDATQASEQSVVVPATIFRNGAFTLQIAEFHDPGAEPTLINYTFAVRRAQ